jgi:diguanylate cyclase (GGDEF)-like protein
LWIIAKKRCFDERVFCGVDLWSQKTLKALILPGGIFLLAANVVFRGAFGPIPPAAINFYYYAVFGAGILLAWRFHSSRVLFALITLLLAHRALEFFSAGRTSAGSGHIALEAVAVLLPLNFIAFSVFRERGLVFFAILPRLGVLFLESVFVAVICRPGETSGPASLPSGLLGRLSWTPIPNLAWLGFVAALVVLLVRFLLYRKPTESGLLWALVATFLSLQVRGVGPAASAYLATAGLILVSSIIETSYLLAYHDELTTLPARRAFNDALFHLEEPYAVAMVDIDHFKSFNDTYGHETGDQVLGMVAAKLAGVTGGGQAYRVGGEEFSILFPGKSVKDVLPHLELLRSVIEVAAFRVRGQEERRIASRAPELRTQERRSRDRRAEVRRPPAPRRRTRSGQISGTANHELSVTVSIGVAEPDAPARAVEQVIQAADKALYRAKQAGRNRVDSGKPPRPSRPKRNIA